MAVSHIIFQSIPVDDQDRALAFYRDVLGFEVHTDAPYSEGWRWIFMKIPGAETRLQFASRKDMEVHDKPALVLAVDDVDKDCAAFKVAGAEVAHEPQVAPWLPDVRWAMLRDTEDNLILLESSKEAL